MFDSDLENENPVGNAESTNEAPNSTAQSENVQNNMQDSTNTAENAGSPAVNWTTPTPIVAESRSSQEQDAAEAVGRTTGTETGSSLSNSTAPADSPVSSTVQPGSTEGTQPAGPVNGQTTNTTAGSTPVFSGSIPVQPSATEDSTKVKDAKKTQKEKKTKTPKEKKPAGVVKKAFVALLCGILFGAAAGGSFYAIYQLAGGPEIIASIAKSTSTTVVLSNTDLTATGISDDSTESSQATWITEVAEAVMPAMVSVSNSYTVTSSYFGYSYTQSATSVGSGIIIGSNDDELLIVTNEHVIEDYDSLSVTFVDGSEVTAYLKGSDADLDIAVMAVLYKDIDSSTLDQIKIAVLGDSDELVLGQYVVAIGNALGYGQSVTDGIVTALNREVETESGSTGYFIQTNAAVNPGNSGGALLDASGRVIGIVSAKIGGDTVEGMGFAIPINSAVDIIEELSSNTTMIKLSDDEKGYLGVTVLSDSYNTQSQREIYGIPEGAYIKSVEEGTGAEAAGLQAGDVITALDGNTVTGYDDLANILQYCSVGTDVTVTFLRISGGTWTEMEVTVTLGAKPTSD